MLRQTASEHAIRQLASQLGARYPARLLNPQSLRGTILPRRVGLPEFCFQQDHDYFLVHPLPTPEILDWLRKAQPVFRNISHLQLILLALNTEIYAGPSISCEIADEVRRLGYGLAVQTRDGVFLVFPPNFREPSIGRSQTESGHIPGWLYQRGVHPLFRTVS